MPKHRSTFDLLIGLSSLLAHHTKHKHHKKHVLAIDGEGSDLLPGSGIGIGGIGVEVPEGGIGADGSGWSPPVWGPGSGGEAVEDPKVQELLDNQRIMLEKLDIIERKILQNPGIMYPGNIHRHILRYGFPMLVLLYTLNIQ